MSLTRTLARIWLAPLLLLLAFSGASLMAVEAEVDVQRSGSIADGATDNTGSASSAQTAYDLTYIVLNTATAGADNLTLGAVSVTSASAVNCTAAVVAQPATVVIAGSATAFTVRVTPTAAGAWSVPILFTTTDSSEPIYNITISGTAQAAVPDIDVRYGATSITSGGNAPTVTGTAKGLATNLAYSIYNLTGTTLNVTVPLAITSATNCAAVVTSQPASFVAVGANTPFQVTVTPGQGAWSFVVRILNSDPDEGFFTFTVSGTASGPEIAVNRGTITILTGTTDVPAIVSVAGEQASLTYTIANAGVGQLGIVRYPADAVPGQLQFAMCRYWTVEGGSLDVTIQRVDGNRGAVTVDWYVDSDSAISDIDFASQSGTLSWADGDIADKTFSVTTIQDALPEGTEQFFVRLHNPQGGATIKLLPNALTVDATVAIEDEDAVNGAPSGGTTTWVIPERRGYTSETASTRIVQLERVNTDAIAGIARLRVQMENGTAQDGLDYQLHTAPVFDTGLPYSIALGVAIAGVPFDYALVWNGDNDGNGANDVAVFASLTFNDYLIYIDGEGKASIPVDILPDTVFEPTESFHLKLSRYDTDLAPYRLGGTNLGTATSGDHDYQFCTVFITDDDASAQTTIITEDYNCTATVVSVPDRTVDAGQTTGLPIRVVPTASGYWQFRVTVVNDDSDEPNFTWLVTGNARDDVPDMAVARNGAYIADGTVDAVFGLVAGTATDLTYTIRNDGTNPLTVTSPAVVAAVSNCAASGGVIASTTISEGGSTTMVVTVTPTVPGNFTATITIANNDPDENSYNITLQGIASPAPAPEFQWYRAGATLTAVATGATDNRTDLNMIQGVSYTIEYRIANLGSADLALATAADSVTASTGFSVAPVAPATAPPVATVHASEMTALTFTFTPNTATWSFTYQIGSNDTDEATAAITISGSASTPAPDAAISRDGNLIPNGFIDAPAGLVATQATVLTYGISNVGSLSLTLTAPSVIGSESNCSAVVSTEVTSPVAAGSSTTLQISVTPTSAGPYSFTVTIPSDDPDENPVTWSVIATAEQAPVARPEVQIRRNLIDIADNSVDSVGSILAGNAQQLSYDVANLGSDVLVLGAPQITATSNCAVQIISAPATSVAAAGGSTMLLAVTPTLGGSGWSFTWSLPTNDVGEDPTNITVVGTGIAGAGPEITVDRNSVDVPDAGTDAVGSTYTGTHTAITYRVSNTGLADLVLDPAASIGSLSNCTVTITSGLPGTLASNTSADLSLDIVATANGAWSFVVTIPNNDITENPYDFTVSGTAAVAPPEIAVSNGLVNVVDGSTIVLNPTTTSLTYAITNVGLGTLSLTGLTVTPVSGLTSVTPASSIPTTLAPGASTNLVLTIVAVNPATTSWSFTVSVANDDADESPFDFTVSAPVQALIDIARSSTDIPSDAAPGSVSLVVVPGLDAAADVVHGTGVDLNTDLTYVISNGGVQALTVTSSAVSALTNCTVSVLDAVATSIAAGGSDNLILRVTPTDGATAGGWSFLMTINSNAADDPIFYLSVSSPPVASLEPEIVVRRGGATIVSGSNDSYGAVMATTSSTMTYVISNQGLANLTMNSGATISAVFNCSAALLTSPSITVVPDASTNLSIQVTPTAAGAWGFTVTTLNNDPDEGAMFWTVSGTAAPLSVTPGDLGLGGGGGGCGAGGALGLIVIGLSLAGLRRRRATDSKE